MKRVNLTFLNGLIIAGALVLMGTLQACDGVGNAFLKKPPSEGATQDTIFSSAKLAKRFLWHAYRSLPSGRKLDGAYDTNLMKGDPLASLTDINVSFKANGGANTLYYTGRYAAGVEDNSSRTKYNFYDSGAWDGIRDARIFIENVGRVPDMDAQTKARLKAEARMIIAVHYTELFRNYGGVPWVDHAFSPNEEFDLHRLTARATLDSIVAVIDRAIPHLPFVLAQPSTEAGRFTQAGAMGLKCRVLLFGASPLFNSPQPYMQGEAAAKKLVWYGGYDPGLWQAAADACGALIDQVEATGAYHLVDTGHPRLDFRHGYFDRGSPELLISTRKRYRATGYPHFMANHGSTNTTHNYVQMFPMAGGTPIHAPGSGWDPKHPYENRDPRLYETVLVNGDQYQGRTAELWIGGRERQSLGGRNARTGYRQRKFILDIASARRKPVQWPYLRLSEIYLSYAEALNEVHGGPTPETYKYVNKVRNRVGLGDLPSGLSQEEFREAVLRERVLELGYENVRWYDVVRWKMKDVFTKPLYSMNICKKGVSPPGACPDPERESKTYLYDRFKLDPRAWATDFSPKWYLSAFPQKEVSKGYLVQNPGW